MAYYLDLFSPETFDRFSKSKKDITGFRIRHRAAAERVKAGDILVCYLTRLSRWFTLLEVVDGPFINNDPILTFPRLLHQSRGS
jgi:hypothetical protein